MSGWVGKLPVGIWEYIIPYGNTAKLNDPQKKKLTPYRNNQLKNDLPLLFASANPLLKVVIN